MNKRYGIVRSTKRRVLICECGGGPIHEHRPNGGGSRILACPPEPFYAMRPFELRRVQAELDPVPHKTGEGG